MAQHDAVLPQAFVIIVKLCLLSLQGRVSATGKQTHFHWFWIWSGVWPAIRSGLRQYQADIILQIAVHGLGIEHVNSAHLQGHNSLLSSGGQDPTLLQAALSMISKPPTQVQMVMEVTVPARLVERAQLQLASTGTVDLSITVQSDFCSSSAPVMFCSDSQALQDSIAGILAVCKLATSMLLEK